MKKIILGVIILLVLIGGYLFFSIFPIDVYTMRDDSMEPAIKVGDEVALNEFDTDYIRGDIVIFRKELVLENKSYDKVYIRRVAGLPNETIEIKNNELLVSGEPLKDKYINSKTIDIPEIKLSSDEYYLLNDKNTNLDSRFFGPIKKEEILGKARILNGDKSD